jgi:hypothetical protein
MVKMSDHSSGNKTPHRNNRSAFEIEKSYSQAPARRRVANTNLGSTLQDAAYNTARTAGNTLSNVATGFINEATGFNQGQENGQAVPQSPDRGGVRIPTYAEFQKEQEQKQTQFFLEQQRAAEAVARKRMDEDRKHIDEIHEMLRKEIEKYEKAQHTMNENLEKIKKMLLLEQQNAKLGIYHVTHAEVLIFFVESFPKMLFPNAINAASKRVSPSPRDREIS